MCKWRQREKHQCKWSTNKVQCKPSKSPIYPRLTKRQPSSPQWPKEQLVLPHQSKGLLSPLHRSKGMPVTIKGYHIEEPDYKVEEDSGYKAMLRWRKVIFLMTMISPSKQSQRNRKREVVIKTINGAPLTRTLWSTSKVVRTKGQKLTIKEKEQS